MERVGSSIGKDSDGAGDSWLVELGMVSSSIGGDIGSWLSCGDEDEEFEDPEKINRRRLRVTGVGVEAILVGLVAEKLFLYRNLSHVCLRDFK